MDYLEKAMADQGLLAPKDDDPRNPPKLNVGEDVMVRKMDAGWVVSQLDADPRYKPKRQHAFTTTEEMLSFVAKICGLEP